jgi:enhancing lycopene biosynthesis protein 2
MKKIAVVLSGCGYLDGSEITESVSLIVELDRLDSSCTFYAPDVSFNPTAYSEVTTTASETRNVLEESARITRGQIKNLSELNSNKYDGLALPGGFGAAKHLSSWAVDGASGSINKDVKNAIIAFHSESKPILAMCIAPTLVAKSLGRDFNPCLTLGNDPKNSEELEKTGAEHVDCLVTDFVTDRENKIISTPAYMYNARPHEVFTGISRACTEFIEMC